MTNVLGLATNFDMFFFLKDWSDFTSNSHHVHVTSVLRHLSSLKCWKPKKERTDFGGDGAHGFWGRGRLPGGCWGVARVLVADVGGAAGEVGPDLQYCAVCPMGNTGSR